MAGAPAKLGWKIFGGVSAAIAGVAARRLLTTVWTKATGRTPPSNPESPTTTMAEAMGWAVLSGVAIGVARVFAMRKAAETWRRSTGSLPPGLETVE
jgi:hypothetical protein